METPPPLVLVIDGDGLTVAALERHLLQVGFRVATANTAASGVRAYARSPAEVVLCASTLPDSDGLSVQRALNALPGSTAFVLIATNAQPTVVAEAFRNHAADVLIAPFDSKELGATLERAMATRPRGALPSAPPPVVTGSPRPGATIAWSLAPDPSAGIVRRPSLHRITSWPRIVEILRRAARGRRGSMLLDGSDAKIEVQLSALTANSSRGYSGALALEVSRIGTEDFGPLPWTRDMGCAIWFSDKEGVHGFRSVIVAGSRSRLVLAQPEAVVRYCRRRERRIGLSVSESPRIILPLADGGQWEVDMAVADISPSGMALALPAKLMPPIGATLTVGIALQPKGRIITAVAHVRRVSVMEGRNVCGLEFEELVPWAKITLLRFVERISANKGLSLEITPMSLPSLSPGELHLEAEPRPNADGRLVRPVEASAIPTR
jgi:CheY-like chemotaxis protein